MNELERLEKLLQEVADRLARLREQGAKGEGPIPLLSATAPADIRPLLFQILQALAAELEEKGGSRVLITGVHRDPQGRLSTWYELFSEENVERVLTQEAIRPLEALASLERLRLMLALVSGPGGAAELMAQSGLTQGQLYHHLRVLEGSGMVRKRARDTYEVTLHGIASLFTFLAAASYIRQGALGELPEEPKGGQT